MEDRFETFTILIAKISRYIRKIKTEETSKLGLKGPHISCIYYLYKQCDGLIYKQGTGLTARELCDICDEDKAAISRAVDFLEKNGYITCESKFEKRYNSPLILTEKGNQMGKKIVEVLDGIMDKVSEGIEEVERENLYRSLFIISNNLQKIYDSLGEDND